MRTQLSDEIEHSVVLDQADPHERVDSGLGRSTGKFMKKMRTNPALLPIVGDGDRDLGLARVVWLTDVASDSDQLAPGCDRDQGFVVTVVDLGEIAGIIGRQTVDGPQKARIARGVTQVAECFEKRRLVA
jgi:hypothetical protein